MNRFNNYLVTVLGTDCDSDNKFLNSDPERDSKRLNFELRINLTEIADGTDIALLMDILPIYVDFDEYTITQRQEQNYKRGIAFMETYPVVSIDIQSYTDSCGNNDYNQGLSQSRANATKNYLVSQGVDLSHLTARGYGETRLKIAKCVNDVPCSREETNLTVIASLLPK